MRRSWEHYESISGSRNRKRGKIMSGLWEEYEKEKQTTRKNKKKTRQTRLGGKRKIYPSGRVGSKCNDPAPTWVRSTNRLCRWHTPRLERLEANQTEIDPLWTIFAEIHRLASHCLYEKFTEVYEKVMKTSKEGKREKTMIETRRGREREAEEEAEVRKQGGIGGGRSWRKAKGRGIKFWGEEGSKGRGNHERIMRRLWENHENIDGSESQKKMAANMIPIDLYESKHYLLGKH